MTREEFDKEERQRASKRTVLTLVSANLLRWLDGLSSIPEEVTAGARAVLEAAKQSREIRDYRVHSFGSDLLVHTTALGIGPRAFEVHKLVYRAFHSALSRASNMGLYKSAGDDFFKSTAQGRSIGLNLRALDFPFTERGAEPIFVAKAMQGGVGAFNRMLFDLFFHPDKGSHQRLDGTRFVATVENASDLRKAVQDRRVFAFGDRPDEESLFFIYPFSREPLEIRVDQVGDWAEMLTLIANPVEWVISAVYAVKGRFVSHDGKLLPTRHEPVAAVSVEPVLPGIAPVDPACVLRLQSGLPAVGEAHFNLGADFHFIVGGPNEAYHVGVVPVTMKQAESGSGGSGAARIAAYTYQSYDNGRIPPDHDVVDVFAQDSVQTSWLQAEAAEFVRCMSQHGEFQPYLTAEEAEGRAEGMATKLKALFKPIPSAGSGEVDPLIAKVNEGSGGLTLSDIKADGGGKVGHTTPPTLFFAVAEASLMEAKENKTIEDFRILGVGDDLQLLMLHSRGADANEIHLLAFITFWRAVWVTGLIGYKPYGLAQDLQIGPATKGKKVDDLAAPSVGFVEMLDQTLPEPERSFVTQIRMAERKWKQGQASVEVEKPFAGNVTGQGPGFAEMPLVGPGKIGFLGADKAGPAAFNIPVFHAVYEALEREEFCRKHGESIAFEIWDIHRHARIFLDARSHEHDIRALLGATNLFNIKRLWALSAPVPERESVEGQVGRMLLSASTERLALITGGQYVGKDDPILLGVEEITAPIFEHLKTGFYMTQGDERGSHYMMLVPKPLGEAVATVRSRGLCSGLFISCGPKGMSQAEDVFASPGFRRARERADRMNARIWRAQGSEFTPVGVGARDVEPAYPLMKVLHRLTSEGSPYPAKIRSAVSELYNGMAE
jgi:fructose 1,6-bisphosphate aldolase/phosphatase